MKKEKELLVAIASQKGGNICYRYLLVGFYTDRQFFCFIIKL